MPNNNIFPDYIVRSTSGGRTRTSEIFSIEAIANQNLLVILGCLVAFALFAPYVSIILLLIFIACADENLKILPLIGGLISLYILIDIKHDWLGSQIISMFSGASEKLLDIQLSMAMVILDLIFLLFSNLIFTLAFRSKLVFLVYSLGLFAISYLIGIWVLSNVVKINFVV